MPFNNPSRMALVLGEGGTTASPETQLPMEPQAGSPGEVTFEQNLEVFWAERKKARSIRPIDHLLGETCNTHSGRGSEKKKKKKRRDICTPGSNRMLFGCGCAYECVKNTRVIS